MPVETQSVYAAESYEAQHDACITCLRLRAIFKNYNRVFHTPSLNNKQLIYLECKKEAIKSALAMLT